MEPPSDMSPEWWSYLLNACVVGGALLLAKITGQIVTKAEMFDHIKAACEAVTANMVTRESLVMGSVATREDLARAIATAIEAFSRVDVENDRLMVERYTEPLKVLIERQEAQQERFIQSVEGLRNDIVRLLGVRRDG
jgi:hypothetical protein